MYDNVIVSGCSISWGQDLLDRSLRFPALIANNYNASLTDYSACGISNELISSNLINGISGLIDENKIDLNKTLVIVQWTAFSRLQFFLSDKKYITLTETSLNSRYIKKRSYLGFNNVLFGHVDDLIDLKFYFDNHNHIEFLLYKFIHCLYYTQLFLQSKNINYVFLLLDKHNVDSMNLNKDNFDLINKQNNNYNIPNFYQIYKLIDRSKIYHKGVLEIPRDNNLDVHYRGHPGKEAHKFISKLILDFAGDLYGKKNY